MRPDERLLVPADVAGLGEQVLEALGGDGPEAENAVEAHRIVDADATAKRLGVVVGHLVGGDVRPHLERAHPDVAPPGPRARHAQGDRRRPGGREHDRRAQAEAPAHEGRGDPGGDDHQRSSPQRLRGAHPRNIGRAPGTPYDRPAALH